MHILADILSVLIVLALVGLIGVIVWIVVAILKLKDEGLRTVRRLSGPVKSTTNLIAAGKGVYDQEAARARRVGARVSVTAGVVQETVEHCKTAGETIRQIDFEGAYKQSKELFKMAAIIYEIFQAARRHNKQPE